MSPLLARRREVAKLLDETLRKRWLSGDYSVSNSAIADHHVICTERTIRKWRSGEKPIPLAALLVLPRTVADELIEAVRARMHVTTPTRRAVMQLREALTVLEGVELGDKEDRLELMRALIDVGGRSQSLIYRLTEDRAKTP